jgi:hypothetical protein
VRVVENDLLELVRAHEQDLSNRRILGIGTEERVDVRRPVRAGRRQQLPPSSIGSGSMSGAFRPAGRIMNSRCEASVGLPTPACPRIVPATTVEPTRRGANVYWSRARWSMPEK